MIQDPSVLAISVKEVYGVDSDPISGVKVYLFTSAGSYQGVSATTDTQGQVSFSLPNQDYKVRAGYLGQQCYRSGGRRLRRIGLSVHRKRLVPEPHADHTDSAGNVSFLVPAGAYKFRVDYDGSQFWSDVVNILSDEATTIDMALDLLAIDDTLNPNPHRFDGNPPQYKDEPIYLASLLNITGILSNTAIVGAAANDMVYYFINDRLGTPQKIIDAQGNVIWEADIKPFGQAAVSTESVMNQFRFAGQYFDTETGLHYNYHRYYDPGSGRYLKPDPIGLNSGINLYVYAENNPIIFTDSKGLFCEKEDACPSGVYTFSGIEYGGFLFLGGITTKHLVFKCVGGKDSFILTIQSINLGGGLGGGIQMPAGYAAGSNKEEVKANLSGFSIFANVFPPGIPSKPGLGLGTDVGTGPVAGSGPYPVSSVSIAPGYGLEVSAGGSYSWVVDE